MNEEDSDRFETLGWVFRPAQLVIVQSLLAQAGIFVCPVGYHHLTNQWPLAIALGGIELRVPALQAEDARALFAALPELTPPGRVFGGAGRFGEAIVLILIYLWLGLVAPPAMTIEFAPARREAKL